ncbi:hypothetical protein G7B21_29245, partial [Klebsiella pneumoniae]|nr:hypothetical protein [Klebsiella pneumoniae]
FILLQAIFPHFSAGSLGAPLAASRRCWPILSCLVMLVALPLVFILLQAIFPHFSAGSLGAPLAASRRCWPILSC